MHLTTLLPLLLSTATHAVTPTPHPHIRKPQNATTILCPILFDGRVARDLTLPAFDSPLSPFSPSYVKGENTTWSSILLMPNHTTPSRFDDPAFYRSLEVTIDDRSLFRAGQNLQIGFRRAGLLLKDDINDPGDAADSGIVTFHWSVKQDNTKALNLSHEYMDVWHERADYSGNQFTFVGGVVLTQDGGTGLDTRTEREKWRVQNWRNEFVFEIGMEFEEWQNFAVQLDYGAE